MHPPYRVGFSSACKVVRDGGPGAIDVRVDGRAFPVPVAVLLQVDAVLEQRRRADHELALVDLITGATADAPAFLQQDKEGDEPGETQAVFHVYDALAQCAERDAVFMIRHMFYNLPPFPGRESETRRSCLFRSDSSTEDVFDESTHEVSEEVYHKTKAVYTWAHARVAHTMDDSFLSMFSGYDPAAQDTLFTSAARYRDSNIAPYSTWGVLEWAAFGCSLDSFREIHDMCIARTHTECKFFAERRGRNLESAVTWHHRHECENNSMHVAAALGKTDVVQYLVDFGCDVNCYNTSTGGTCEVPPIYYAAAYGHLDVVRLLASRGSVIDDPGLEGLDNANQLHWSYATGSAKRWLAYGGTILTHVSDVHVAAFLLDRGAAFGRLTLAAACAAGRSAVARLLVGRGVSVSTCWIDFLGQPPSAIGLAIQKNDAAFIRRVLDREEDPGRIDPAQLEHARGECADALLAFFFRQARDYTAFDWLYAYGESIRVLMRNGGKVPDGVDAPWAAANNYPKELVDHVLAAYYFKNAYPELVPDGRRCSGTAEQRHSSVQNSSP